MAPSACYCCFPSSLYGYGRGRGGGLLHGHCCSSSSSSSFLEARSGKAGGNSAPCAHPALRVTVYAQVPASLLARPVLPTDVAIRCHPLPAILRVVTWLHLYKAPMAAIPRVPTRCGDKKKKTKENEKRNKKKKIV